MKTSNPEHSKSLKTDHLKIKQKTAIDFTIVKDKEGNVLNPEVVSVAVQDKKDACDINRIIKKVDEANKRGEMFMPASMRPQGQFGDFTNARDFQESHNRIIRMNDLFMRLPAETRAAFDNNPVKLVEQLEKAQSDIKVKEELIKLGVLNPPKFEHKKLETPQGSFWITTKDGVEISRDLIKTATPAPGV